MYSYIHTHEERDPGAARAAASAVGVRKSVIIIFIILIRCHTPVISKGLIRVIFVLINEEKVKIE